MSKVKDIREMRRRGHTVAEISRRVGVSEPTVRKHLRQEDFSPRMPVRRELPSILDPYEPKIDEWLAGDRANWHKQRHTSKRVFERLRDEEGYEGSYNTVNRYVQRWRDDHRAPRDKYLDLDWLPGEMQVDFGQADFRIVGVRRRMHHLVGSFPFSNVGLPQIFPGENAECVCSGLIAIFEYVGGVPPRLVFDNATGVGRKIYGEIRTSELFSAFAAHYGFDYSFCNPDSGNEKGNVEYKVGALRRPLFVPIPMFDSVASTTGASWTRGSSTRGRSTTARARASSHCSRRTASRSCPCRGPGSRRSPTTRARRTSTATSSSTGGTAIRATRRWPGKS